MNDLKHLLTDEFVKFSEQIKILHEKKKNLEAEFKVVFDKMKADLKVIDDEAKHAHEVFEEWKSNQKK